MHVLVAANLAWVAGFTARRHGWDWTRCAGLALVTFPFFHLVLQTITALPRIHAGLVLAPLTDLDILRNVLVALLFRVVFPLAGLLLVFGWRPRDLGRFLAVPRYGLRADAEGGQALFGFVALLYGVGYYAIPRLFDAQTVDQAAAPLAGVSVLGAVLLSL